MTKTLVFSDASIKRNRKARLSMLIKLSAGTVLAGGCLGAIATQLWFSNKTGPTVFGFSLGSLAGGLLDFELLKASVIENDITDAFITINRLNSLLGRKDAMTVYGPGSHICYPWERRIEENTISTEEITLNFTFTVQAVDAVLTAKGSVRLRPDIRQAVKFVNSAATAAEDLRDLVIVEALPMLAKSTGSKITQQIEPVNKHLQKTFVKGSTDFEKRFGVIVGDVTIGELLPSKDLQKTLSAITEAAIIQKGVAALLGLSQKDVREALKSGTLNRKDYDHARDRFLSISGNLEGMDISRNEIDLNINADAETAKAIQAAGPALVDAMQMFRRQTGRKPKGNKK